MKSSTVALLALSAAAERAAAHNVGSSTTSTATPSPTATLSKQIQAPGFMDICTTRQQNGFNWDDAALGPASNVDGFKFSGWNVEDASVDVGVNALGLNVNVGLGLGSGSGSGSAASTVRAIVGDATSDTDNTPSISANGSFSIDEIQLSTEFDAQLEFRYLMADGSLCTHIASCSPSGTTVKNTDCHGSTGVSVVYPGSSDYGDSCRTTITNISFSCGSNAAASSSDQPTQEPTQAPTEAPTQVSATDVPQASATDSPVVNNDDEVDDDDEDCDEETSTAGPTPTLLHPQRPFRPLPSSDSISEGAPTSTATSTSIIPLITSNSTPVAQFTTTSLQPNFGTPVADLSSATSMETFITTFQSTSTIFATSTHTISSCAPDITDCPARAGPTVVTDTIVVDTTICPVTATMTRPVSTPTPTSDASPAPVDVVVPTDSPTPTITPASDATPDAPASTATTASDAAPDAPTSTAAPAVDATTDAPTATATAAPVDAEPTPTSMETFVTTFNSASTVFTTSVHTFTSCAPDITDCPARAGPTAITVTIAVSTTICPVTATMTRPAAPTATPDSASPAAAVDAPSSPEDSPVPDSTPEDSPAPDSTPEDSPAPDSTPEDSPAPDSTPEDSPAPDSTPEDSPVPDSTSGDSPVPGAEAPFAPDSTPEAEAPFAVDSPQPTTMVSSGPSAFLAQPTGPPIPTGMPISGAGRLGAGAGLVLGLVAAVVLL